MDRPIDIDRRKAANMAWLADFSHCIEGSDWMQLVIRGKASSPFIPVTIRGDGKLVVRVFNPNGINLA